MEFTKLKFEVKITVLLTFADKSYPQFHDEYYKVLVNEDDSLISEYLKFDATMEEALKSIYNQYMNIDFSWPYKKLCTCEKISNKRIELVYMCQMPFLKNCIKNGKVINFKNFNTIHNKYGEIIIGSRSELFR